MLPLTLYVVISNRFTGSFDIDFPIECDDEYWNHPDPSLDFKQPPGRPSAMSFFNCYLRLMDILAYTMRFVVRSLCMRSYLT